MRQILLSLGLAVWATNPAPATAAEFLVIPGTSTLAILGDLRIGDVAQFERYVDDGIEEVLLSSDGGSLEAAWQIGATILNNQISTRVADDNDCVSACAIMFLHGFERHLGWNARVGVHLPFFRPDANLGDTCEYINSRISELQRSEPHAQDLQPPIVTDTCSTIEVTKILVLNRNQDVDTVVPLMREISQQTSVTSVNNILGQNHPIIREELSCTSVFGQLFRGLPVGRFIALPPRFLDNDMAIEIYRVDRVIEPRGTVEGLGAVNGNCLTDAFQLGAYEFSRLYRLIVERGMSYDLVEQILFTPSSEVRWLERRDLYELNVIGSPHYNSQ